jgi:indole-3-glycerol phosphate synthase/phosphoribosylanthranilate isomerase
LATDFNPAQIASAYQSGGASALSVLTDETFFQGSLQDLERARRVVTLPVLRKDFTIAERHIVEAAATGADAILLIAAILNEREIRDFREAAARYRMAALVEVHNRRELDVAVAAGSDIIGVNNRDLTTFQVTLATSLQLADHMPPGVVRVSESGIHNVGHIAQLRQAGYTAFLVGEHLMTSGDASAALRKLVCAPVLKICGITNQADATAAIEMGASAVGFNFYPRSPRYITPERAASLATPGVRRVGVFVNEPPARVAEVGRLAGLDVAQLHGDEAAADYPAGLAIWKAARITNEFSFAAYGKSPSEALVLDGPAGNLYGGSGRVFDWSQAAQSPKPVILAGGLDSSNVAAAVALAHPWGVDACSKIEVEPGKKDHQKMQAFLTAAKAALGV